jgi:hypothetical protein
MIEMEVRRLVVAERERVRLACGGRRLAECSVGRGSQRDVANSLWAFRSESTQEIHNKAYRQNQAEPAAANDGTAKVKPAAAEQEKQNN